MAELTVYARSATATLVAASSGGDSFRNDGATELLLMNAGASSVDVTFAATARCKHGFLDDQVETIEAGEFYRAGPFDASRFNNSQGLIEFTYDDETPLTVAAQKQR